MKKNKMIKFEEIWQQIIITIMVIIKYKEIL